MRFTVRRRRQPPAVIIVSLIDIMIVLLIFLLVTTTFKDAPALKLTLPESKLTKDDLKPGVNENPPLIVTITTNRPFFYLGKTPVTIDRLESELQERVKLNPGLILAIRADTEAAYGNFVKVTEAATQAKVKEIKSFLKPGMKP